MQAWVMGLAGGLALPLRTGLQVDHEVNARSDVSAKERMLDRRGHAAGSDIRSNSPVCVHALPRCNGLLRAALVLQRVLMTYMYPGYTDRFTYQSYHVLSQNALSRPLLPCGDR